MCKTYRVSATQTPVMLRFLRDFCRCFLWMWWFYILCLLVDQWTFVYIFSLKGPLHGVSAVNLRVCMLGKLSPPWTLCLPFGWARRSEKKIPEKTQQAFGSFSTRCNGLRWQFQKDIPSSRRKHGKWISEAFATLGFLFATLGFLSATLAFLFPCYFKGRTMPGWCEGQKSEVEWTGRNYDNLILTFLSIFSGVNGGVKWINLTFPVASEDLQVIP